MRNSGSHVTIIKRVLSVQIRNPLRDIGRKQMFKIIFRILEILFDSLELLFRPREILFRYQQLFFFVSRRRNISMERISMEQI